jgi:photosystem II stability/assembly factor-like uncharacterized protein
MSYLKATLTAILLLALAGCSSSNNGLLVGEKLNLPTTASVSGIYFVDAKTGYAATAAGEVFRTEDGGKSFSKLDLGTGCRAEDLYFLNDDIGFAFGRAGYLMRTADAGKSWAAVTVDSSYDLRDMVFLDKEHGFAVGVINTQERKDVAIIGKSADKGLTWSFAATEHHAYRRLSVIPTNNVWILGGEGTAYSTDQGATWGFNAGRGADTIRAFSFSDIIHGWAVGDRGVLRYSSDGGWSWKDKAKLSMRDLTSIAVPQLDVIYLAGDRFLGISTNHGRMWLVDTLNYTARFNDCQAVGKETDRKSVV